MVYKAVFNDNSLYHYNKNHSSKNGQFVSGDGDGDGIANDHLNQRKKQSFGKRVANNWKKMPKGKKALIIGMATVGTAAGVVGSIGLGKDLVNGYRNKKEHDYETKKYAAEFVERQYQRKIRQESAKAKFVGGDW